MNASTVFGPGALVMVRCTTYHYTGKVASWDGQWLTLTEAAWVADSGRWTQAIATGEFAEVEVYPAERPVLINAIHIVDATNVPKIPKAQV